jgi:hypothetical protein
MTCYLLEKKHNVYWELLAVGQKPVQAIHLKIQINIQPINHFLETDLTKFHKN